MTDARYELRCHIQGPHECAICQPDARRGWLKDELEDVRNEVAAWPAWKRGETMDPDARHAPNCVSLIDRECGVCTCGLPSQPREVLAQEHVEYLCNEIDCNGNLPYTAELLLKHNAAQREQIRALADRLAASERELQAIRDTVGDTEFALRQQLADMTRERDEAQRSKNQCVIELYQKLDKLDDLNRDLKQQLAEAQGTVDSVNRQLAKEDASRIHLEQQVTRLREALQLIANSVYTDAAPPELRAQNERVCCLAQQALREAGAGGQP